MRLHTGYEEHSHSVCRAFYVCFQTEKDEKMTKLYFVRHAQTDYSNPVDKERPLTKEGMQDRFLAKEYFVTHDIMKRITHVYASDFQRAMDTVAPIADALGKRVEPKEAFREWTLIAPADIYYETAQRAWENFDYRYADCETLHEVQTRNIRQLEQLLQEHENETIVIGTHGTALSTIIQYYQPEYNYQNFLQIMEYKPWIVRFEFDKSGFLGWQECFRHELNIEKST